MDPQQVEYPDPRGHRQSGGLRAGRGIRQDLRLHLGHLLRLVYRADQDPPERRGCAGKAGRRECAVLCAAAYPGAAAPVHALHHRGDLAGAAPRGPVPHLRRVAGVSGCAALPGGRGRYGGRQGRHLRHPRPPRRDERAAQPQGSGHPCDGAAGELSAGRTLHHPHGLRQRADGADRRACRPDRHGDRRHPRRHGVYAHG